jgi:hypothetical protein
MFDIQEGFDIVIGNPPYVGISKLNDKENLQKQRFETYERTGDLYSLFYENGNSLLKIKGTLNFITSRQWINASYGKSTRNFFIKKTNPVLLIDFGKVRIFENATVFVNILMFEKNKNINRLKACLIPENFKIEGSDLSSYIKQNNIDLKNISENVWKIGAVNIEMINQKIESKGVKLKDWQDIEFFRGVTTGLNEAFHIDKITKNELIGKDPRNIEVIKPLLRGKDIKRYEYEWKDLWLINTYNGELVDSIDETTNVNYKKRINRIKVYEDYLTVFEYLQKYETELINRDDKGVHWSNLRNCAFEREFSKEKIIWIEISDRAYFMSGVGLKYILAVLNSRVSDFYFSQITAKIAGGRMRYTKQYVEQIPIPPLSTESQAPFITLVDKILAGKKAGIDTLAWEAEIDLRVYKLYELSHAEVLVVEPGFGMSEEEYVGWVG